MAKKRFNLSLAKAMMQSGVSYAVKDDTIYGPGGAPLIHLNDYAEEAGDLVCLLQNEGFIINHS